jgi:S-adenosylmethionine synthetase
VKIMGLRRGRRLHLTIAMAFVDRFIESEEDYFRKKGEVEEAIREFLSDRDGFDEINFSLNVLDTKGRGIKGLYLTVLGTSAEGGDSGQVGRGNNVMGVIPLNRPISSEAAAGKNPVSHVGKIYNTLTFRIAKRIMDQVNGLKEVYVWLLSDIGRPINEPKATSVQAIPEEGVKLREIETEIREIVEGEFERLDRFCMDLAMGRIPIC